MRTTYLTLLAVLLIAASAFGQANPCNPCGGKAVKAANPCGEKAANPCGEKAMAVNPCFAKVGQVFYVNDPMGRNSVTTESAAPLEDIVGTSNQVSGYIVLDPAHPEKGGRGEISVPVASLSTGIPLRDEHLRSADWLNAATYPNITLTISDTKKLKKVKETDGAKTYDVKLKGELSLHGRTRPVEISGRFTYLKESDKTRSRQAGDLLAVRANFEIPLSDYGVTGPKGMSIIGSKVGETISVAVSFVASNQKPLAMAGNPCGDKASNPCGSKASNPCGGKAANPCNPCGK